MGIVADIDYSLYEMDAHQFMLPLIPERLRAIFQHHPLHQDWLAQLPELIHHCQSRWSLQIETPFDNGTCAWVAPVVCLDGTKAVLKLGLPHMEGHHEIQGLRFWNGAPTVHLLAADEVGQALLLERCEPGTPLGHWPETEQDHILARLLRQLWIKPAQPHPFRPLSEMLSYWANETLRSQPQWPDSGLVQAGLDCFEWLSRPSEQDVLLATDLHAGNVLQAKREPWLVIDPKPFVGDPAYDATQHLRNGIKRVAANPDLAIAHFADLLEIDAGRIKLWLFARAAAEPRSTWNDEWWHLAKLLAP